MRKLTPTDRLEALLMECSIEEFTLLCERFETVKRLRSYQTKTPRKARAKKQSTGGQQSIEMSPDYGLSGTV